MHTKNDMSRPNNQLGCLHVAGQWKMNIFSVKYWRYFTSMFCEGVVLTWKFDRKKILLPSHFYFPSTLNFSGESWKVLGCFLAAAWSNCCSLNSKQTKPFHQIQPIFKSSDYLHSCLTAATSLLWGSWDVAHFPIHTCIGMKSQALQTRAPCPQCMEWLTTNSLECSFAEMLGPCNFWPGQDFRWAAFLCYSMRTGVRLETARQRLSNQEDVPYASCWLAVKSGSLQASSTTFAASNCCH